MNNNGFNLHYKFRNDSTGVNWNTSIDYTWYTSKDQGAITENPNDTGGSDHEKLSTGTNGISLLTGKLDYNKKLNDHWKFSLGAKYYGISNNSNLLFQELVGTNWVSDTSLTTGFNFAEGVGAAYAQTVYKKDKFNMRLGIRGERTQTAGTSSLTNASVIDTAYMNLFPTAFFGYKFSKDLVLGLNYTSRFNRPRFQDINPFVEYLDSVSAFIGNPLLLPEYSHSARASLTYLEAASIEIGYTRTPKERLTMVERNLITNGFLVQDQNINFGQSFNIDLTLPYQTKKWTTYNGIGYAYTTYNFNDPGTGELREISVPSFNWYVYNEVQLPWNFSIQGTFWWTSSGLEGIFEYQKIYGLNATITKKFFDDALSLSLTGNDILSSYIEQGKSNLEGFEVQYKDRYDTHFWQIRIQYAFGKLKGFDAKDKAGNREETGRIK
jgi:iron complex outermembrane receptor protein